jgi:DNA polymerase III alpha subunit (gram-positive type)
MKFIKDLLLFDLETTGPDVDRDVVLQFGAVLLDKYNLIEKSHFSTYLRNSLLADILGQHARLARVDVEVMQNGLKPLDFLKELESRFSGQVTLAVPNLSRFLFLRQAFKKQSNTFPFELNALDLWSLYYVYGMRVGLKKIPSLSTLVEHFHLTLKNPYDAYERARAQASVLRRVCEEL